jgi:hypothetical protein
MNTNSLEKEKNEQVTLLSLELAEKVDEKLAALHYEASKQGEDWNNVHGERRQTNDGKTSPLVRELVKDDNGNSWSIHKKIPFLSRKLTNGFASQRLLASGAYYMDATTVQTGTGENEDDYEFHDYGDQYQRLYGNNEGTQVVIETIFPNPGNTVTRQTTTLSIITNAERKNERKVVVQHDRESGSSVVLENGLSHDEQLRILNEVGLSIPSKEK